MQHADAAVTELLQQQRDIGWHLVKYGLLSKKWAQVQAEWVRRAATGASTGKTKGWKKTVQDTLWNYVVTIWEYRNTQIHGSTRDELRRRRLKELRESCRRMQQANPRVGTADEHLLGMNVGDKQGFFLHHWKRAMEVAIKKEAARQRRREGEHITQYLQQVRRHMKGQKLHGRQRSIREYFDGPEDKSYDPLDTRREALQVSSESVNTIEVPAQQVFPTSVVETPNDTEE